MKNIVSALVFACLALVSLPVHAQKNSQDSNAQDYIVRCVAFYNLENLFDTIHDFYVLNTGDTTRMTMSTCHPVVCTGRVLNTATS